MVFFFLLQMDNQSKIIGMEYEMISGGNELDLVFRWSKLESTKSSQKFNFFYDGGVRAGLRILLLIHQHR